MKLVRFHVKGFWIGFAFGTIGLFVLALLRLLFPIITVLTVPFFWPSRFFAFLVGDSTSTAVLALLYVMTGITYGMIGSMIQEASRMRRSISAT